MKKLIFLLLLLPLAALCQVPRQVVSHNGKVIHVPLANSVTVVNWLDSAHVADENYAVDTTIFELSTAEDGQWSLGIRFDCITAFDEYPSFTLLESCDNGRNYIPVNGSTWPLLINASGMYDLDPDTTISCAHGYHHYLWTFNSDHFYGDHLKLVVTGYRESNDSWYDDGDVYTISAWMLIKK